MRAEQRGTIPADHPSFDAAHDAVGLTNFLIN